MYARLGFSLGRSQASHPHTSAYKSTKQEFLPTMEGRKLQNPGAKSTFITIKLFCVFIYRSHHALRVPLRSPNTKLTGWVDSQDKNPACQPQCFLLTAI